MSKCPTWKYFNEKALIARYGVYISKEMERVKRQTKEEKEKKQSAFQIVNPVTLTWTWTTGHSEFSMHRITAFFIGLQV